MKHFLIQLTFVIIIFGIGLFILLSPAKSHSFYSAYCCNENDCAPVKTDQISRTAKGWFVPETGETVPYGDARIIQTPSPHVGMHICIYHGLVRCLYAPESQG